ncbi:hypothetical protein GL213_01155 [Halogeometricum borinquense]|uniref:STAS/SEC14 domain-containing protein n=1 Tax=Halogeometricum borinquense TaxID=60847 RepID=A0A6C0UTP5_9EURY|nr:hypothetical protein [Halogeometricum borinquense]QIB76298.1 hypothetical protein G3I44_19740 [Halogeometricum borinquense]QIQ75266.1 hypothetical protein GL213_01155 [Halogeometricum borinquense]
MSADVYRYDIVDGVAVFDLTEFEISGDTLLEEFFGTVQNVFVRPDVTASVFVLGDEGGISKRFFQRFDFLVSRIEGYEIGRVALVGPSAKQVALRGRFRGTDVIVETPETPQEAMDWARA